MIFQPTHSCWTWLAGEHYAVVCSFQSTHPCGIRRWSRYENGFKLSISIHTTTKGATITNCIYDMLKKYFKPHTFTGCDGGMLQSRIYQIHFNPHIRAGCDEWCICGLLLISTHTSTQYATVIWRCQLLLTSSGVVDFVYFNLRIHAGCDYCRWIRYVRLLLFQSTQPRGLRPLHRHILIRC